MKTQTWAILVDAYRDLNSRKLFWIVIILSVLAVAVFALFGTSGSSVSFLWFNSPPFSNPDQAQLVYKYGFSFFLIGIYLTWIAIVLALISTASIFPDLMTGGSIDLYLSKPISRLRLFLTKYASGLLFVTLQVTVFVVGGFIVLGLRGHTWEPTLFLAIPIIVIFFSYLYGICVLIGVLTRSTIAALLLTFLAWFLIFTVDYVDKRVSEYAVMLPEMQKQSARRLEVLDHEIAELEKNAAPAAGTEPEDPGTLPPSTSTVNRAQLANLRQQRAFYASSAEESPVSPGLQKAQTVLVVIKTFVPKTRETTNLLDRYLLPDWQLEKASTGTKKPGEGEDPRIMVNMMDPNRNRSPWWVIGTSLLFEAACIALAAWIFNRRDY